MNIAKTSRRAAREFSFQYLYHIQDDSFKDIRQEMLSNEAKISDHIENNLENFQETIDTTLEAKTMDFSLMIIKGTLLNYSSINEKLSETSKNWKIKRLSKVDHTILLQAIFELTFVEDTPTNVVINESIEIAKKFGNEKSNAFINGILDKIAKDERN